MTTEHHAPASLLAQSAIPRRKRVALSVDIAHNAADILAAQKLRYQVFADELGAKLNARTPGIDCDIFDEHCQHLIVRNDDTGEIVGTYRILTPEAAKRIGSYYSETEFDLTRLQHLRANMVEIGRSCVHADFRTGATIALLWSGLAKFMVQNGYGYLIGCASISMQDGGHTAASIYQSLNDELSPIEYRVFPRLALPLDALRQDLKPEIPPLIKGYLRAGAYVCGAPAWDPDFNTADLPILMPMTRLSDRYSKHFISQTAD